jgi:hypothetical protein
MMQISRYAKLYAERYGFHMVPIEPMRKFPTAKDWGNKLLSDPIEAESFYKVHPDWNLGVSLSDSNMCALDIDCMESFKIILDEFGIPEAELLQFPTIQGSSKGVRIEFKVPKGANLPYQKLNWPKKDGSGSNYTVFELRSGTDGKQRQNVYPPSIHPDTKMPYQWIVKPPKTIEEWPEPPQWLLAIWGAWSDFKPQLADACPWLPKPEPKPAAAPKQHTGASGDVIGAYCAANAIQDTLERYGYKRKGKRYLSPHSSTGLPGVHILGDNCWIHHASDPLCSEESGHPVNSFDLFCYYEHGSDVSKAVKAAAEALGMKQERKPVAVQHDHSEPVPAASTPQTDYVSVRHASSDPLPDTSEKGVPWATINNLATICNRLGIVIRYNVISKEEEVIIPGQGFSIDNEGNAALAWLESECSYFKYPTGKLPGFVTYLADRNQYNPVVEWVSSKPWDGQDHLGKLLDTITIKDKDKPEAVVLKDTLVTRWMISAIAGAFSPKGVSAHGVLVFQGEQYVGKTKWFKGLVPEDLNLIKDGVILKPDDRDSVKQAVSFWLVELGELDSTFRKSDIAALKAFITNDKDVLRRAYARKESQYARRTVFFGSVNPKQFLHDPTGNRRYWTIEVEHLDHSHSIDMQQVWAQVHQIWKDGASHYLTPDEMAALNGHNEEFTAVDPIEEAITSRFDWDSKQEYWRDWLSATDALKECGYERPTKADATAAGCFIRKLNGGLARKTSGGRQLLMPPLRFK